ncbi:C6 zinc finger protein [Penicillium digitatum]|uniref:Uncharacterized protein n=3 Tax=Penicillium digitatum TaxID=36651 RepID=K9H1C6_PEND2|nr:hypothetical protein PDIP_11240 [Penicillium digitatum Pd1]EKV18886.1 hypothetical protein PDIG_06590 [Penicillium digitatum PHI26]EKV20896.1 hypothetical protein PDIP_11240 [Penicillium digitatum Pd1]QQK48394.1 C6 zinc finger protein [Penicillium digitatum]
METKRLKRSHATYPSLAVDDTDKDLDRRPEAEKREWGHRVIERTTSMEWGTSDRASLRAELEPMTTGDNERLLRTHHRSLSKASIVYIVTSPFGRRIWVTSCNAPDITVGGLDIHILPIGYPLKNRLIPTQATSFVLAQSLVQGQINPRKFLTEQDLESLRILFPNAIGAQLLISGFLRILFDSVAAVERTNNLGYPSMVGELVVLLDTAKFSATAQNLNSGAAVSDAEAKSVGCLGLKLKLPGGKMVLTTVTHAYVHNPALPVVLMRVADWVIRAKNAICRFRNPSLDRDSRAFGVSDQSLSNNPTGKDIFLFKTKKKVGTITHCFDNPSPILPYPVGYRHDLSLIEGEALSEVVSPPGYPVISAWARYENVLAGVPLYAVALNAQTQNWRVVEGTKVTPALANALLLGTEYIWDREASDQAVAMLWRSKEDVDSARGYSGSVLCTGTPTDQHGEAVVFQNYETGLRILDGSLFAIIKAGFLLPREIRESIIVVPEQKEPISYNTVCGKGSVVQAERRFPSGI